MPSAGGGVKGFLGRGDGMLIDAIRSLFGSEKPVTEESDAPPGNDVDPVHLAACALLLEVAHADGEFSAAEFAHLEEVLERHFSLPPEAGHTLLDLAEKERTNAPITSASPPSCGKATTPDRRWSWRR